jgi:hypothetical protein
MSYSVILVGGEKTVLFDIQDEAIVSFFRSERRMFSNKLSVLPAGTGRAIKEMIGETDNLGVVSVLAIVDLAGRKKRPDVFKFIKDRQEEFFCTHVVGR